MMIEGRSIRWWKSEQRHDASSTRGDIETSNRPGRCECEDVKSCECGAPKMAVDHTHTHAHAQTSVRTSERAYKWTRDRWIKLDEYLFTDWDCGECGAGSELCIFFLGDCHNHQHVCVDDGIAIFGHPHTLVPSPSPSSSSDNHRMVYSCTTYAPPP